MENHEFRSIKRAIDLGVAAGRKRQSPRTKFVHLFPSDEGVSDTIPLFENFCFAMALFRQRSVESVLEGKELLERLLAFQNPDGNFPLFLHDFPKCYDPWMGLRIAPILVQIQRHFGSCIGADAKEKIGFCLERILAFSEPRTRPPLWEHRFEKLRGNETAFSPETPEEWFHWLATEQLGALPNGIQIPFHPGLQVLTKGPEVQEKGEPRPSPIEWVLAEKLGFSERLLRDHPGMIQSAMLFPVNIEPEESPPFVWIPEETHLLWGGSKLHSLAAPLGKWTEPSTISFDLSHPMATEKGDLVEAALFLDISPETELTIDGKKGTVFYLGDLVQIRTPSLAIDLRFHLVEGEGDFCGQISRANRPSQTACKGALLYEAFDWRIALRTLRRLPHCRISLTVNLSFGFISLSIRDLSAILPSVFLKDSAFGYDFRKSGGNLIENLS